MSLKLLFGRVVFAEFGFVMGGFRWNRAYVILQLDIPKWSLNSPLDQNYLDAQAC